MAAAALSMTQGWMIGIMAMMGMFGVAAGIFAAKGKTREQRKES
ncbi:MAG: hypothetical protein ACOX8G_05875 [Eubacterium sp.]|nr:hypothetical protein [Clostridium sp. SY8519]BAK46195.1 hypothetical protein CXIVA_02280 [Clostridium sp. SY8519]